MTHSGGRAPSAVGEKSFHFFDRKSGIAGGAFAERGVGVSQELMEPVGGEVGVGGSGAADAGHRIGQELEGELGR